MDMAKATLKSLLMVFMLSFLPVYITYVSPVDLTGIHKAVNPVLAGEGITPFAAIHI
jgi:hypothetical protein